MEILILKYTYEALFDSKDGTLIYTPPAIQRKKYPVLYLLHGIGGDEKEWLNVAEARLALNNLYAEGKIEPMVW